MYKIKIAEVERLVGLEAATTLALKLLSGSDFPKPWLFVEAFRRIGDTLAERHCWEFPRLTANAELTISIVESGSPDQPDESDTGPGHLAPDERIVVKEGIRRTEAAIAELEEKRRALEDGNGAKAAPAPYCSFCGKSKDEAKHLIAGQLAFICDECIHACVGILAKE